MRLVIIGAGAIGGVLGARLYESGSEVLLVARGANHDAIAAHGLTLETPDQTDHPADRGRELARRRELHRRRRRPARRPRVRTPRQRSTRSARLRRSTTPVVCLQNGVENERVATRRFAGVYGAVVMAPTAYLEPGVVQAYGTRSPGRSTSGATRTASTIAATDLRCAQSRPLRLGAQDGHHALQAREADRQSRQRRPGDLRPGLWTPTSCWSGCERRVAPSCGRRRSSSPPTTWPMSADGGSDGRSARSTAASVPAVRPGRASSGAPGASRPIT